MHRVLIIEDEQRLLRTIRDGLKEAGYDVLTSLSGDLGLRMALTEKVDAVILDLMLPGMDGFEVLRRLRAESFTEPVLILTARDGVKDRVQGLDRGADDFLVKPFSYAELLARLRALLRRGPPRDALTRKVGTLSVDLRQRRVFQDDREIELSRREFDLLDYLLRHQGQVVSREMLAREVWRDPMALMTNVIDVFVNRLRRKLGRDEGAVVVETVRGVGYIVREATP